MLPRPLAPLLAAALAACSTAADGGGGAAGGTGVATGPAVCHIGGVTYLAQAADPQDACERCDPATDEASWTSVACPADAFCSDGGCVSNSLPTTCASQGQAVPAGHPDPANPCRVCNPTGSATGWIPLTGLPQNAGGCGGGNLCLAGSCVSGCLVDGGVVDAGTFGSGCEICLPALDPNGWSPFTGIPPPALGICTSADFCDAGVCSSGCAPDCRAKCPGAGDSCGGVCPVPNGPYPGCAYDGVEGCCDSNGDCQPGTSAIACGAGGACQACVVGLVCASTANGATGCCAPNCTGKCPHGPDGCGGICPVPAGPYPGCVYDGVEGCCDASGSCQPGNTSGACTVGGACEICPSANECIAVSDGGHACCQAGGGCPFSCGDPTLIDACGNVCPQDCPPTSDHCCGLECCANGVSCTLAGSCGVCLDGAQTSKPCTAPCSSGSSVTTCENGAWGQPTGCSGCPLGKTCDAQTGVCG